MKLLSRLKNLWALSGGNFELIKKANGDSITKLANERHQMAQIVSRVDPLADIIEK